ncbi:Transmembrane protein 45B [Coccomyxa sp. Obi]|nr:Transmembrane protein 45B [Coccomyxa sp. Obi]
MSHSMPTGTPNGSMRPEHGTWPGHVLPGSFFLIWSSWWLFSTFRLQLQATRQAPFRSCAWFPFSWGVRGKQLPLEPILKVLLPFLGINAELWAGHTSYRNLYAADGRFETGNLQDWQHSAMYAAFLISGLVDLIGFRAPAGTLPPGTEHAFLGLAFAAEGLLFAFHLKGTPLDWSLHFLLVILVFAASLVCFGEYRFPGSFVLTVLRGQLVLLQGIWFIQIAEILFKDKPAWAPDYHASAMMVPVVFVTWTLSVLFATLAAYVALRLLFRQRTGSARPAAFPASALPKGPEEGRLLTGLGSDAGSNIEIAAAFERNGHIL